MLIPIFSKMFYPFLTWKFNKMHSSHKECSLYIISIPPCSHLMKANTKRKKEKAQLFVLKTKHQCWYLFWFIHLKVGITLSEEGPCYWKLRQGGTSKWRMNPA